MLKKSFYVLICLFCFELFYGQTQATLDSLMVEYKECIAVRNDRVNCTKELFWVYQDLQFDFNRAAYKNLDSISRHQKDVACGEWVKTKDFFVGNEILKFRRKHPKERIDNPGKAAENDAYTAFKNICDFFMVRLNFLLQVIESKKE